MTRDEDVLAANAKTATKTAYLYTLADPRTPEAIRYVGWTKRTLDQRLWAHLYEVRRGNPKHHRAAWLRSLMAVGIRPLIRAVAVLELGDIKAAEVRYIAALRLCEVDLVNCTDGGDGAPGYRHTPEHRARVSAQMRGNKYASYKHGPEQLAAQSARMAGNTYQLGKKRNPEAVEKTAAAMRGRKRPPFSDEWRANLSRSHIGKVMNEETIIKMSVAQKLRRYNERTAREVKK